MKKKIWIILSLVSFTILLIIGYFILYENKISIKLNGKDSIKVEVNEKYKELGVTIKGTKKGYTTTGKVNTKKLGNYKLTYTVNTLLKKNVTRTIIVVDTKPPIITLTGGDVTLYTNEEYKEPGFTAVDNYDKDLTNKVTIENNVNISQPGEYEITYYVEDTSKNKVTVKRKVIVKERTGLTGKLTYINGILLVNKKYSLPSTYNPGINPTAGAALKELQRAASTAGYNIPLVSGFRSYSRQKTIYNNYVKMDGQAKADTYSARPGNSEHQSGLAFDVGEINDNYGSTPAGIWLTKNAHNYGFIIRYPQGKTHITGYKYEPWHIRYVGKNHATNIYNRNITLEEYLGV